MDKITTAPRNVRRHALLGSAAFASALLCGTAALAADADQAVPDNGPTAAAPEAASTSAQEIIVTGSRITQIGFTAPTPVTTLAGDSLAKTGSLNIGEALAQLPSFRATTTPANTAVGSNISPVNAGARIADLRGLGPSRTLVLVNSRRFTPSTSTGTVDLNLIPTLLVERADVVTGGASAAYGSDAVSGVINIVLANHMKGVKTSLEYGLTDVGDGKRISAQIAGGFGLNDDRGHVVFGVEYDKDEGTGGCYTRDNCANEVADLTGTAGANGRPAHNITYNVHTATLTPGGLITATTNAAGVRTAAVGGVLGGIQFDAAGQPTTFNYGQYAGGLFMQGGTGAGLNSFFGDPLLSIPVTRYNAYGRFEYEVSPAFTMFTEASFGHVAGYPRGPEVRDAGFPGNGTLIKVDNPFLPASIRSTMTANGMVSLTLGKLGTDFGTMDSVSTRDSYRAVTGASGSLGGSWSWDAYVSYGITDYRQSTINDRITANYAKAVDAVTGPNGTPVCRVNADASTTNDDPNCVALKIIGQGQYPAAAKAYAFGTTLQHTQFDQLFGAANVHGDLFDTWAGPVAIAAGIEGRRDHLKIDVDPISAANGFYVYNSTPADGRVKVVEGYIEAAAPLLKDSAVGSLSLNGAIRQAHYSNSSAGRSNDIDATTWKVGATYSPIPELLLRATLSQDVRAPNASELFTSPVSGQAAVTDPKNGSSVFVTTFTGGNVNLKPETARTFTGGVTLQPGGLLNGLKLSADYFQVTIHDAIATLGAQLIINTCNTTNAADICGLVTRNSSNVLQTVSVLFLNLNRQQLRGFDFEASYRTRIGAESNLDLRVLATHTMDLNNSAVTSSAGQLINRAGDNGLNGVPSWIVDTLATLSLGRLSLNAQGHFLSAGKVDATYVGPEDAGYSVTLPNSINTNRVPSRFYTTIGASFDVLKQGSRKLQAYATVVNLFNVNPPPYWNGNNNSVYYDNVGRRYRFGLRYNF
jgi:outer membrane receptor protein involved in Fe transport